MRKLVSGVCRRGDPCGRWPAHSSVREHQFTAYEDADPQWGGDRYRNAWIDPACLSVLPFPQYGVAVLWPHCPDVLADGTRRPASTAPHGPFTMAGILGRRALMLLSEIGSATKNHGMPVQRYVLLHSEARLSDQEREQIYRWTRAERKRLKSAPLPSVAERQKDRPLRPRRESRPGMLAHSNVRIAMR